MCRTWGSNSGPLACQANSLPIELPRPVNVNALDNHVWSLLLHKNKLRYMKIRNLWRKWTRKSILSAAKSLQKWHVHCVCFENATSRANTNVMLTSCFTFATMHATDADVTFYDGPGMHTVKATKQVYNSTWIALLKHGFVLVKTWLLIACGTGFYAIMIINCEDWVVPVTVKSLGHTSAVGDVTVRRSKMHGEFVSLKQRPVTSRAVFYKIKSAVARIFTAW